MPNKHAKTALNSAMKISMRALLAALVSLAAPLGTEAPAQTTPPMRASMPRLLDKALTRARALEETTILRR